MQDYVRKINHTVWTCCILHNLLLAYDGDVAFDFLINHRDAVLGLDKLWTEEDYLSCWYADADAEIHPEYDGYVATTQHDALIRARAEARSLRHFNSRVLGERRPSGSSQPPIVPERFTFVPHTTFAAQIAMDEVPDSDPVQWQPGFAEIRESLIEHFNIAWNARRVQWLRFPPRK